LSSILEALKKAEQESVGEREANTPWPAPLPKRSPYPPRKRRWWLPLGLLGMVCIGAALFWQFRHPGALTSTPANVPLSSQAQPHAPTPATPLRQAEPLIASKEQNPPVLPIADQPSPQQSADEPAPQIQAAAAVPAPSPEPPAVPPAHKAIRKAPLVVGPKHAPPALPAQPLQTTLPPDDSVAAATDETQPPPEESVDSHPLEQPPAEENGKTYRSDPRIELQALVWAPQASARFVVINNRLLKEGGATDGITVVQINRDDVLLAEGSDRWHEKFKIR